MTALLTFQNVYLKRSFDDYILEKINLDIMPSQIITLIGPNGAGKTTLLKIVLNLIKPDKGSILRSKNLKIGYMPQKLDINPLMPLTVKRFLSFPFSKKFQTSNLSPLIEELNIEKLLDYSFHTLSVGERQRVLLAYALLGNPNLLVLDEPSQGVDILGQSQLYNQIAKARDKLGCAILLVSHDLHIVMAQSDQVICLNHHICCSGHPEKVQQDPAYKKLFPTLFAPYTHHHDHKHDNY